VPRWLLNVTSADDVSADQLTGPPMAVRVSWPVVLAPRSSRPGITPRLAFALGVPLEAGVRGPAGGLGSDGNKVPGRETAATGSNSVLVATDGWKGPVRGRDDRSTLTGRAAPALSPG
jgi:hypothetical protein